MERKRAKNIAKTVVFVIKLSKGNHNLHFIPRGQAEIILEPTITKLNNAGLITILKDVQSEEEIVSRGLQSL